MLSNYPPGVTGHEPQIAGGDGDTYMAWRWEVHADTGKPLLDGDGWVGERQFVGTITEVEGGWQVRMFEYDDWGHGIVHRPSTESVFSTTDAAAEAVEDYLARLDEEDAR